MSYWDTYPLVRLYAQESDSPAFEHYALNTPTRPITPKRNVKNGGGGLTHSRFDAPSRLPRSLHSFSVLNEAASRRNKTEDPVARSLLA